ncbi:Cytochrome P450 family protein [Ceratobasidium theobromae]|uniref:Cytochrome P450 family protein n=1 Tax=Ceratobasidium theobromae TaxID=1582974 RepID=A0A5N5QSA8_9AGAM|nr:Cytochrome P450 family protein [Ceratobasidium theobromae]
MEFSAFIPIFASLYVAVSAVLKWCRTLSRGNLSHLPGPPNEKWSKGHIPSLYNPNTAFSFHDSLSAYGPVAKLYGVFGSVRLYINDPHAMANILLKNEGNWQRTDSYVANLGMVLGPGLLATKGIRHKAQRKVREVLLLLHGCFTNKCAQDSYPNIQFDHSQNNGEATHAPVALKQVHPRLNANFTNANSQLVAGIEHEIKEQGEAAASVDIFKWTHRGALDAVGLGGMGHDFQMLSGGDSEYSKAIKHLLPALFSLAILRPIMPTLYKVGPAWFRRAIITRIPSKAIKQLLWVVDVQHQQALKIFEQKKMTLGDSKHGSSLTSVQKDVVTLMLQANEKADAKDKISEEEMLGQLNTLIFAGHDTTSGALACTFQMLAEHPEVQEKLREELLECPSEDPDYGTLEAFPLLDAVIKETLRLHPPVSIVERVAVRDTVLPLRTPANTQGSSSAALAVPAGTLVMVSLRTANRDPATWGPDALEWNPYRWLRPLSNDVIDARIPGVYSNMMTFLGGSHSCIIQGIVEIVVHARGSMLIVIHNKRPVCVARNEGDCRSYHAETFGPQFGGTSKPFVVDAVSGGASPGLVLNVAAI